jgi:ubiquinone/menaquinone biosynthesis C-methylase UbiE
MLVAREAADVQSAFSDQWRRRLEGGFERQGRTFLLADEHVVDYCIRGMSESGKPPGPGTWILDAGCGTAEKAIELARRCPDSEIVALDFSDSVFAFHEKAASIENLHLLQADVTVLPFSPGSFDHVVSLGVLHHTGNPEEAFSSVAQRVREGGSLTTWIYPAWKESPLALKVYYAVRDVLFLGMGHRMPGWLRYAASVGLALPLAIIGRPLFLIGARAISPELYKGLSEGDWLRGIAFLIYDCLGPRFQFRIPKAEVLSWYRRLGFRATALPEQGLFRGARDGA